MKLMDGIEVSRNIYCNLIEKIKYLYEEHNIRPKLSVIIVGNRPDSLSYVKKKQQKCKELEIESQIIHMPSYVTEIDLLNQVSILNKDSNIHGILVQLPLPEHINQDKILSKIDVEKDVDGFHYTNMGLLTLNRNSTLIPCTPKGCITLLKYYKIPIEGKHVVIIGKSNVVGLPLSLLLMHENATVTVCHHLTKNIKEHTQKADILISACGVPHLIDEEWIKDDVDIIDVGINFIEDSSKKSGKKLVGDVNFERVKDKVNYISPVPGGVGPMTIAMLIQQTVDVAFLSLIKSNKRI
jgi:methylenetetrahydrofolate dehydrogenase (NADP+) / methenyltetrahydrofolate cyclohydrolase / formyltetrahydrofolate synthetase